MSEWMNWIQFFFSYKGRIKRFPFFVAYTALLCFYYIVQKLFVTIELIPISYIIFACCLYSTFVLSVKRLRDLNRSPWLCLLNSVPGVNIFFLLYLFFKKSVILERNPSYRNHYIDAA